MYVDEQITIHPPERTIEIELPPAAEAPPRKAVVKYVIYHISLMLVFSLI